MTRRRRTKRRMRVPFVLWLVVSIAIALGALGAERIGIVGPSAEAIDARFAGERFVRATVVRVVDGDTIRVRLADREESVRYIGVDTPEVRHPRVGKQPFGPEASQANRELVKEGEVVLVFDVAERDRYGRLLAYVYLPDGTFVNETLVEMGLARVLTVPPNVRHARDFQRRETEAREAGRGMWGRAL